MTDTFDPTKFHSPSDVASELARVHLRMQQRDGQMDELLTAQRQDEHHIANLDRWMLAIFDANPEIESIRTTADYRDFVLIPDNGLVLVYEAKYANGLEMLPYPIEPDADDELSFLDDELDIVHPDAANCQPVTLPMAHTAIEGA